MFSKVVVIATLLSLTWWGSAQASGLHESSPAADARSSTAAAHPTWTPGVTHLAVPASARVGDVDFVVEGPHVARTRTRVHGASWTLPTSLGLRGGDVYRWSLQACAGICRVVRHGTFAVSPAYCRAAQFVSRTVHADGSVTKRWRVDGEDEWRVIPPAHFRPVTATAAQLRRYHFPERPAAGKARSAWATQWSHYTGTYRGAPCMRDAIANTSSAATDPHWSGTEAYHPGSSTGFDSILITYLQPGRDTSCTAPYGTSVWAGIGGQDSAVKLIQAGTEMDDASGIIVPFFEEIGNSGANQSQQNLAGGGTFSGQDKVNVEVEWDNSPQEVYDVFNNTTGKDYPMIKHISGVHDGGTAEAIAERPARKISNNWYLTRLEPFGSNRVVAFKDSDVHAFGHGFGGLQSFDHLNLTMVDNAQTSLTDMDFSPTNPAFNDDWDHCGTKDSISPPFKQ